jgi:hypothetical protein
MQIAVKLFCILLIDAMLTTIIRLDMCITNYTQIIQIKFSIVQK